MTEEITAEGAPAPLCDTSDMLLVHALLRRIYRDAPGLVESVPVGDTARAAIVADHVETFTRFLHHHHHTEDVTIWDKLSARTPACAVHVALMRAHHKRVGELLGELEESIPAWRAGASHQDAESVARRIRAVNEVLFDHLGQEEAKILPAIAQSWSQEEWDAVGKRAAKGIRASQFPVLLGFLLETMPEEERPQLLRQAPAMVRVIYRLYGRRQFDAYRRRVYGLAA
ncbi:MAG TPA: hemerythrin domain-containing protein [Longimicrobium sp.]|nr:hemerythrin domain-containing protein [Longimicrobium sp.]